MSKGTTYKRCTCRSRETGKELGKECPKLRRGNGFNSAHGSWYWQVNLPADAAGKPRTRKRGGFDQQTDAQAVLDKISEVLAVADPNDKATQRQIGDIIDTALTGGEAIPTPQLARTMLRLELTGDEIPTAGEWLDNWIKGRRSIKRNTWRGYEAHIRLHIKPVISEIRLDKLGDKHMQEIFDRIEERNELITSCRASPDPAKRDLVKGMKIVGPTTMHRVKATLRKALNDARRYLSDNPARSVELPPPGNAKALMWTDERVQFWQRTGKKPSPVMVWTEVHTGHFLDHCEAAGERLYALFHLIALRGLRRGEACGLHWTDVDLINGTITIRWQITQLGWATELDSPKTDASEDTVVLDDATVAVLRAHRRRQLEERLAAGPGWIDTGLVFTTPTGQALHPANVTDHFKFLTKQAGLPPIRLHDLRHVAAALMLLAGVDIKTVSATLRHSSIVVTADIYGSIMPKLAKDAAEKTSAIVPRKVTKLRAV